jgi:hypothetical protein
MKKVLIATVAVLILFAGCAKLTAKRYLDSVKKGDPKTELLYESTEDDTLAPYVLLDYEILNVQEDKIEAGGSSFMFYDVKAKCDFEGKTGNVIQKIVTISVSDSGKIGSID